VSGGAPLAGKVCIVTGANTGIGRVTARRLAEQGGHVFLAGRSREKTEPVVAELRAAAGHDRVEFLALDLTSLASVRAAAAAFLALDLPLHILVNNAGLAGQRGLTQDGFELHFGVNHLGPFLFTTLLQERLQASAPARVVVVSSKMHERVAGIDYAAVRRPTKTVTGMPEYGVSKLANVYFAKELARRAGPGVHTYALHPGVVASDIWRRIPQPFRWFMTRNMVDVEAGAETSVYCATAPEAAEETGLYYQRSQVRAPSKLAEDPSAAAECWRQSAAFVAG
jgi:retinol dehydrogenase-12